jgi:hypothetical protein
MTPATSEWIGAMDATTAGTVEPGACAVCADVGRHTRTEPSAIAAAASAPGIQRVIDIRLVGKGR